MGKNTHARSATEREWIGAAIRRRRLELGLRQKDAAEIISAAGPHVTQQVLAKIEAGDKLLEFAELLAVCFALDIRLLDLLFPFLEEDEIAENEEFPFDAKVVPKYIKFSTGQELSSLLVFALASGDSVDPLLVEGADMYAVDNPKSVHPGEVLDLRAQYLGDPVAIAVGEILDLDAGEVTQLVRSNARAICEQLGMPWIARKKVTATDLFDAMYAIRKLKHPDEPRGNVGQRQVRTALTRDLAAAIEEVTQ